MTYEVFDNFLPEQDALNLRSVMLGTDLPWYFNPVIVRAKQDDTLGFQFVHVFYMNYGWASSWASHLDKLVAHIDPTALIRIKANLNPATHENYYGGWHSDSDTECKAAVYYVNDNNGWTEFENGDKVESKANRLLVFDARDKHSGVSATDVKARCIINFNFME